MSRTVRTLPLLAALALGACSSDGSGRDDSTPAGANGGAANGGTSGGGGGFGDIGNPALDGGMIFQPPTMDGGAVPDGSSGDGALNEGNACGMGMAMAELTPVNMTVMFDRSGSMRDDDKWANATRALSTFFRDPGTAGLKVALRFFPHNEPAAGCNEDGCNAEACAEPLVPIGEILAEPAPDDAHEQALLDAIESSAPGGRGGGGGGGGGTPIYAALDGALRWATDYRAQHPDETTVVVFVTDGEPNGCDEDFDNISALAEGALASDGILTFAIGLAGSSEEQMDQLAVAGGTDAGIFISNSANAEQELLEALNRIRGQTLSCDFPMPEPADPSMPIDPAKVNVTFTSGAGAAVTLPQATSEADCGTSSAWFYDDPSAPTRITLCPAACERVRDDAAGSLQILLGCETVCGGLDVDCGGEPPPDLPPIIVE